MNLYRLAATLALACLLAAPTSAWSQDNVSHRRELAQQIMDETGMTANLDGMMKQMTERMMSGVAAQLGPEAQGRAQHLGDTMSAVMARMGPRIMTVSLDAYAETFSEQELSGILAFYRTPVGRSMAAKMPQLMRNITDATVTFMPEIQAAMAAEICATEACPDALKSLAAKGAAKPN